MESNRATYAACGAVLLFACSTVGCVGTPVAPFDGFATAPVTAYRLQNWEPPAQATTVPSIGGLIPGLPPEIDNLLKAGSSILPPGLLPPGLLPGTALPAQAETAPRFHGFRVIGAPVNVIDDRTRREFIDIFGFEKNFDNTHAECLYAEFGVSFARAGQPPADVLISISCDQVQGQNFIWPHRYTGLTNDSRTHFVRLMQRVFSVGG